MFKQSGVVPYRIREGKVEILLITSSGGKHWIIPKGWVEPFMSSADSAAKEAREEAGVMGSVVTPAIGQYQQYKLGIPCPVEVFLMQVEVALEDWAEAKVRQRRWHSVSKAMKQVREPELKQIFKTLEDQTIEESTA